METTLSGPIAYVGRDPRNDVLLSGPGISRRHAYFQIVGQQVYCVDLGSRTGLYWDRERRGAGWADLGTEIRIGPYWVRFEPTGVPAESRSQARNRDGSSPPSVLDVHRSDESPLEWNVADGVSLLGRATPCVLRAADPRLDAYHCALVRTGGELWVVDLRSGRGTQVNGRPIHLARLRDGDILQAGSWTAVARCPDLSAPSRSVAKSTTIVGRNGIQSVAEDPVSVGPLPQMMEQFQNCMTMMGQMLAALQEQHMLMVREQINQFREVSRELLDRQLALRDLPWASPVEIPWACEEPYNLPDADSPSDVPTPSLSGSDESRELLNAHAWFTERLADFGHSRPSR